VFEADLFLAQRLQPVTTARIGTQEAAISAPLIIDDQRRRRVRQPLGQDVVADRGIFLGIVDDQVPVTCQEVLPARPQRPEMPGKHLVLEREIQQVVGKAGRAEAVRSLLHLIVDPELRGFTQPCGLEPRPDLRRIEANHRSLVQVIQDLAVETVAFHADSIEIPGFQQRPHHPRHEVLCGLQGEKDGRPVGMSEASLSRDQRPVKLDHPLAQPAYGNRVYLPARRGGGPAQESVIGRGQRALRQDKEDVVARHARTQQVFQARHSSRRLPRAGDAFEEDPAVNGQRGNSTLRVG